LTQPAEVFERLGPAALVQGVAELRRAGVRFVVVRDDLPGGEADPRAQAVVHLVEEVIGWRPIGAQPRIYVVEPVRSLAARADLFVGAAPPAGTGLAGDAAVPGPDAVTGATPVPPPGASAVPGAAAAPLSSAGDATRGPRTDASPGDSRAKLPP